MIEPLNRATLNQRLDNALHDTLRPIAFFAGLYYIALAILNTIILPPETAPTLVRFAVISSAISFGLRGALRLWPTQSRHAHPILAIQYMLALINHLVIIAITGQVHYTFHIMLILIAGGALTLSPHWLFVFILSAIGGWILVIPAAHYTLDWLYVGFGLLLAALLALITHRMRYTTYVRLINLHARHDQQAAELRRRIEQQEANRRISERINAGLNRAALLNEIIHILKSHYHCTYVGILLLSEDRSMLHLHAATDEVGKLAVQREEHIRMGRGIIGWAAQHQHPVRVDDTSQDTRFITWDLMPDTRAELALPLQVDGKVLGVLDMQSNRVSAFEQADMDSLSLLSNQIAFALQNAKLHDQERYHHRLAETLYNVGRALARPLERDEAFEIILSQIVYVVPHDRGTVLLQDGQHLEMVATRGFPENKSSFPWRVPIRSGDVFDEMSRSQRPLVLADAMRRADWYHLDDILPARSWMGVPLIHDDKVVGMLSLARETHLPYSEDEVTFAATFAVQAMIALENAYLHKQIETLIETADVPN